MRDDVHRGDVLHRLQGGPFDGNEGGGVPAAAVANAVNALLVLQLRTASANYDDCDHEWAGYVTSVVDCVLVLMSLWARFFRPGVAAPPAHRRSSMGARARSTQSWCASRRPAPGSYRLPLGQHRSDTRLAFQVQARCARTTNGTVFELLPRDGAPELHVRNSRVHLARFVVVDKDVPPLSCEELDGPRASPDDRGV